jgi:hypothetical protein
LVLGLAVIAAAAYIKSDEWKQGIGATL